MKNALFCSVLCCALLGIVFVVGAAPSKAKNTHTKERTINKGAHAKKNTIGGNKGTHKIEKNQSSQGKLEADRSTKQRKNKFSSSGSGSSRWNRK